MSAEHDRLRSSLRDLADVAEPIDLYDRALHRSQRIARREAVIGTGAAVLVLAVLVSGLWRLPQSEQRDVPVAAASRSGPSAGPSTPSTSVASPTAPRRPAGRVRPPIARPEPEHAEPTAEPSSRALADLPGQVFYAGRDVVRFQPSSGTTEVVLPDAPSSVGISPDGDRIAYVTDGKLLVSEAGGETRQVADGVVDADQAPVWSPAGDRLLIDAAAPGVLDLETGTITPLPGSLAAGQHFRWSGDGTKLVYATSSCGLKLSADDDTTNTTVPGLGATWPRANPDGLAACKPTSVDATGERVTVPLQTTGESATGRDTADAVIDTATGRPEVLPVAGAVIGAVFDPDGNLLVRTEKDGRTVLWLFAPDNTLRVEAVEPAAVRSLELLAYTR